MRELSCWEIREDVRGCAGLMTWPASEVLLRHCCDGDSFEEIGAALSMTATEVRCVHEESKVRLAQAIEWLLSDLELERLRADPESVLRELWEEAETAA